MTLEQDILSTYDSNPVAVYSINEISKRIGKSYPYVNKKVHALIEQGILRRKESGRSHLCSVNLANKHAVMLLAINELEKHENIPQEVMRRAKELDNTHAHHALIYDPTTKELLVITEQEINTQATTISQEELRERLLNDEVFYAQRIVISGHEHFFKLLSDAEIQRRYHPLL